MSYARQLPRVLGGVFRNPELRRVQLAFACFNAAEWGVWIAMLVYAYDRGGATTAGLVALAQLVPAALFAPVAASLGDRRSPGRVLALGYVAQAVGMAATASVLLADGPALAAYGCAALAATAVTVTRPAQAVLMPSLARSPEELTAANVVAGWIESISLLAAPALAGILLGVSGAGVVFSVMAVVALVAALLVAPISGPAPAGASGSVVAETLVGLRVVVREPGPRALVWLLGLESMAIGALDVLYVVLAVAVLGHGGDAAGYLNAAFGAGGVLGVVATVALVGRRRLALPLAAGLVLWALALGAVGAVSSTAAALGLLAMAGAGRTVLDVAGRTLLQRLAPPEALGRVFGLLESVSMAGLALGSVLAPVFVALAGGGGAFVCLAVLLPVSMLLVLRSLLAADQAILPIVEMARLRSLPFFAPLAAPELESLARALEPLAVPDGTTVIREGDSGDRFYVVADGEVEVTVGGAHVKTLGRGDCFGEIALIRNAPRMATVTARSDCTLDMLDKESFVTVVTGRCTTEKALEDLVQRRLEEAKIVS
ncbi:MAG TPA: cyclic nucleotide-binding domain-containing protein [Gaiellaceae bacterium]|nr:cyclic nucleotide-binding domain-containing protein [Gaiellaceae bacterium]